MIVLGGPQYTRGMKMANTCPQTPSIQHSWKKYPSVAKSSLACIYCPETSITWLVLSEVRGKAMWFQSEGAYFPMGYQYLSVSDSYHHFQHYKGQVAALYSGKRMAEVTPQLFPGKTTMIQLASSKALKVSFCRLRRHIFFSYLPSLSQH